jgi:ABC-type glycerol-3-phosphate transport system substrate-binding protein
MSMISAWPLCQSATANLWKEAEIMPSNARIGLQVSSKKFEFSTREKNMYRKGYFPTFCVVAALALFIISCSGPSTSAPQAVEETVSTPPDSAEVTADQTAPIKIYLDEARQPVVTAFLAKYPEYEGQIQMMVDSPEGFAGKLPGWNKSGSGWPDVVFSETNIIRLANTEQFEYFSEELTPRISKDVLDQFYPGANVPCTTPDGKLICLRNDLAPNVLYFNVPLFEKWKYTVPTTWEEFLVLAGKVSKEHPGTLMLALDNWLPDKVYYAGSECPMMNPISPTSFLVNFLHPNCQRMSKTLDDLNALGVADQGGFFSQSVVKKWKNGEWLTWVGPVWMADYIIRGYYLDPASAETGSVGIAPALKYADQKQIWSGSGGGAAWAMSRHTKNPELALKFILFAATDPTVTSTAATLSAFQPGGDAWAKATVSRNPLIASDPDPYPTISKMAGSIWPDYLDGPPLVGEVMNPVFTKIQKGSITAVDSANDIQKGLEGLVQTAGLEVVNTGP